jgi:hypothetical protein
MILDDTLGLTPTTEVYSPFAPGFCYIRELSRLRHMLLQKLRLPADRTLQSAISGSDSEGKLRTASEPGL